MADILVASLGESPIVVTAMFDLLTKQEKNEFDKVVVLRPEGDDVLLGYELVEEALKDKCPVEAYPLPFEDTYNDADCFTLLQILFALLSECQQNGDTVYLSLAGGRKSMSALIAIVVPLFPCVKKLYHVLGEDEDNFLSIDDLYAGSLSDDERKDAMHPLMEELTLIAIPFGGHQYVSDEFRSRLFTLTDEEDLEELWDEAPDQAVAIEFVQDIANGGKVLEVMMTEHAARRYKKEFEYDERHKMWARKCFRKMRFANKLRKGVHGNFSIKSSALVFHFYKSMRTQVRPFFHTEPRDIAACPDCDVKRVLISDLEIEQSDYYRQGDEILHSLKFPLLPKVPVASLLSLEPGEPSESVLIVPLGKLPMVATQLYTLLKSDGVNIHEVVLVYPELSRDVRASALAVKEAFEHEDSSVKCWEAPVRGLKDVDSTQACEQYEQSPEDTIKKVHQDHPNWKIELALSGGRKGMAALAMFVAQRLGIRYVYHTLITDKETRRKVARETRVSDLHKLGGNKELRSNRLFLRAYEAKGEEPYTKFVLFKVPVLPAGKS